MSWSNIVQKNTEIESTSIVNDHIPVIKKIDTSVNEEDLLFDLKYNSLINDIYYNIKEQMNDCSVKILDNHKINYGEFYDLIKIHTIQSASVNNESYSDSDSDDILHEGDIFD